MIDMPQPQQLEVLPLSPRYYDLVHFVCRDITHLYEKYCGLDVILIPYDKLYKLARYLEAARAVSDTISKNKN